MKIREDVQILPIEINGQSAGVSQEEQIFYTNDEDETEEQYWARKEAIIKNLLSQYKLPLQIWLNNNLRYNSEYGRSERR